MTVKSTVKINQAKLKQLTSAAVTALEQTGEALHTEIVQAQVVPRDQGDLQNEKFFPDTQNVKQGKVSLTHEGPYARRLYYHPEYHFQTKENPNAKGHWFEDWGKGGKHQEFCHDTFMKIFKKLTGV